MKKTQITSPELSKPTGQFSHATAIQASGTLVFVSGMTPRAAADGSIVGVGDIEAQTHQVCKNIRAAMEAAGGSLDDVCRLDVYIRNMENFSVIHKVRSQYFNAPLPSSTMVEVTKFVHPDILIEMTAIGVVPPAA